MLIFLNTAPTWIVDLLLKIPKMIRALNKKIRTRPTGILNV
jgi:hypothetical protein